MNDWNLSRIASSPTYGFLSETALYDDNDESERDSALQETYILTRRGPALHPGEFEDLQMQALEVIIMWQDTVLTARHSCPAQSFYVGEEEKRNLSCDYLLPAEVLGAPRAPLVIVDATSVVRFVVFPGATGWIECAGQPARDFREVLRDADVSPCNEMQGAFEIPINPGTHVHMRFKDFVFRIGIVPAGKVDQGLWSDRDWSASVYAFCSAAMHLGILASVAAFLPPLGINDSESVSREQLYLMQQYLNASAEREREPSHDNASTDDPGRDTQGGTGTRAMLEGGSMGTTLPTKSRGRYAIRGPSDNPDPRLARERARTEATNFGLLGLINTGTGAVNSPTAPWGEDDALGRDPTNALGAMWGSTIGDNPGSGGLDISGTGLGGGGSGLGIGLDKFGLLGNGAGAGLHGGIGSGPGRLTCANCKHGVRVPRVTVGQTIVGGHIPAEVIQRIVRQNFGRFRMCYEDGLRDNPNLRGRVAVRFVIGRDGAVSQVSNGGSDIPSPSVISCVVRAYYNLSFPPPDQGIVTVVYPIVFAPGD